MRDKDEQQGPFWVPYFFSLRTSKAEVTGSNTGFHYPGLLGIVF